MNEQQWLSKASFFSSQNALVLLQFRKNNLVFFLNSIISIINGDKRHEAISLESLDKRAFNFYKVKLGFSVIGIKLRFFKNLKVQIKFLKE